MKKIYTTPQMKEVKVQHAGIICASNGTFGVANNGNVTKGNEEDLSDADLGW